MFVLPFRHSPEAQRALSGARDGSDNKFYAHRVAPQFILPRPGARNENDVNGAARLSRN